LVSAADVRPSREIVDAARDALRRPDRRLLSVRPALALRARDCRGDVLARVGKGGAGGRFVVVDASVGRSRRVDVTQKGFSGEAPFYT
jgi:hypothetical protein